MKGNVEDLRASDTSPTRADIDKFVGDRIANRRVALGLSQQQMADLVGVSYQQMRKYEKGLNRIAAGRLFQIAQGLDVEVGFFFEGMSSVTKTSPQQRILLELTRNFIAMTNHRHQEVIYTAVRMLADEAELVGQR